MTIHSIMVHPQFDPVALSLGPIAIRWYGLMYLIAFAFFLILGRMRLKTQDKLTVEDLDNLLTLGVLGVVLGGRLGYVLFYKPAYYFAHPTEIFAVWQGGMSFHGGFLGVLLVVYLYARNKGWSFWNIIDFVAPTVPVGLGAGRLGNFINGELWGRPTDGTWGMIFPQAGDALPRHPSQLYQMALEGLVFFIVLWWFSSKPRPKAAVSGVFLIGYGLARFTVEFAREPDRFLGTLALGLSMGQWLSAPMVLAGIGLLSWSYHQADKAQDKVKVA